jgi:hypothetical protein
MWRSILVSAAVFFAVYGYGHPMFADFRPTALDRALQSFHTEVNGAARLSAQAVTGFDRERAKRRVRTFVEQAGNELSGQATR